MLKPLLKQLFISLLLINITKFRHKYSEFSAAPSTPQMQRNILLLGAFGAENVEK